MGASFLNLVATKVTVKGEEQKFVSLHLRQGFNRHHTFTVMVNYLSPNNTFQQTPEKFIGYIGETASISFVHRQTGESYDFEGIITQVEMVGSMGETGGVAIHGTSPTILYENNRTLDSWMDQSLSTIIKEVTQEYGKVNLVSNPKYATPIPYMAQYNESVFDFMNRLSALYGEWFYYDGTKVYFGKPDRDNTEKIVYDMDLEEVRLVANLVPGKSARYDYVAQENKQHNADTPAKPDGMNDLQSIAHSCSEKAYTAKTTSAADPHVTDKAELDEQMRIVKNASGANLLNIKGIGKTCRIRIGEIIDVSFPDRMKLPPLGKFRIVGIEHEVRRDGHYSNSFVGVPDGTVHIPVPDVKRPLALPELATVKENNDDKGQGRVKVAFDWQKNGKTTNWIRVQTPNAGVSGAVPKNRGWVLFFDSNLSGGDVYKSNVCMTCNYLVGRGRYAELGETEDLLIPPSAALAGSVYKTVMAQVTAGKKYGSMSEVDGVAFNLKKSEISEIEKIGLIPMVKEYGKVMAFSAKTLFNGDNLGLQTYSVVRVFDWVTKVLMDFLNRRAFENWNSKAERDLRGQISKFLDSIQGPGRLIEKFKILRFERDPKQKDRIFLDIHLTPYFPAKSFVIKLEGTKGDDENDWNSDYAQDA